MSDRATARQLIAGFHRLENNQWRWTAGRFAVILQPPVGSRQAGAILRLQLYIPAQQIETLGPMTLTADVRETSLAPQTFANGGTFSYSRDVPPALFDDNLLPVVFTFDKALAPTEADGRELGAVVTEVSLEPRDRQSRN